ncbi:MULTISPECIES: hypothetical protein [unclassified Vibrio]|uniref:hypothetical protein n=1 Tax=unclassified Vibrio TaxID=2614977 RepID=UPI000B8E6698|nr:MULTISPECIES: hypothetical protein [unclassified Vibrio]NAW99812.1 hypothetical protein [Vibrio sp. V23_P3S9T160]OXX47746.1 hypothetical protein B9J85_03325 [Vibrio sp. V11_P1A41T118]
MLELLNPYLTFLYGAAYNLLQTLDAMGLASTNFLQYADDGSIVGSYWSPAEANLVVFVLLSIYFLFLVLMLLLAGYALGRLKGVWIAIGVIALPGLMNVWGLWPDINYTPESYNIMGTGSLGDIKGYLALAMLACLSGWSIFVVLNDIFCLGEKFKGLFDHAWYAAALVAGVIFIYDTGANSDSAQLNQERQVSKELSGFFLTQLKAYDQYCKSNSLEHLESCKWSVRIQNTLYDYIGFATPSLFASFGPNSTEELYRVKHLPNPREIKQQIRIEIQQYNDLLCPYTEKGGVTTYSPLSAKCIVTPSIYCNAFPENSSTPIKGVLIRPVALASECLIPTLVQSRDIQEKLSNKLAAVSSSKHYRWMYLLAFAVFIGAKIANTTTKVVEMDKRESKEKQRVTKIFMLGVVNTFKSIVSATLLLLRFTKYLFGLLIKLQKYSYSQNSK